MKERKARATPLRRSLTKDEVSALFSAADDVREVALLSLAAHTGLRQSEIAELKWRHVDLDKGTIAMTSMNLRSLKSTPVVVPVDPSLREVLRAVGRGYPDDHVLGRQSSPHQLSVRVRRMAQRAGIPSLFLNDLRAYALAHAKKGPRS